MVLCFFSFDFFVYVLATKYYSYSLKTVLKIIMDAMLSNRIQDCYIVPISIGYDKVIETETYINELLGIPKEKESLWGVITNSRLLQLKMGRIDVRFAKPYSLRNFMNQEIERRE